MSYKQLTQQQRLPALPYELYGFKAKGHRPDTGRIRLHYFPRTQKKRW